VQSHSGASEVQLLCEHHERPEMPQPDIRKRHDSIVQQSPPLVNVWGEAGYGRSAKIGQMSAR
jgi:hypothetical protein